MVALAGLVGALGAGAWLAGQLAALLAWGRWPPVPLVAGFAVVARLPAHLSAPRTAWPAAFRADVPGPTALAAAGAAVLGVAACLTLVTLRRAAGAGRRPPPLARRARAGDGRWATARDLRALLVPGPVPGRLVIGRVGRRLVATEARHSVLVLGPTQSGKTTGLAVPALLEWEGPAVATSVKGDLVAATAGWRHRHGRCWVFDPTAAAEAPGAGWSPLQGADDWSGAQRMAAWLVDATPARRALTDGDFWYAAAAKQLGPLLRAARLGGGSMADVVRWTNTGRWEEAASLLDLAGELEAAVALDACAARDERIRSSVATTLETVLAPFEDPVVAARTAQQDVDPRQLVTGPHTLYLCGPSHEQARVQGLFAALVASVVAAAAERVAATGNPLDPPLLLVLDEVANIAPIRDLDGLASTAAGLGIQLVTVCQDLAQLAARYGQDRSRTIANNHRAKLVLSGVADPATLDLVSGLAGERAVRQDSVTTDLRDGRRTRSTGTAYRRLVAPDELRRTQPGEGVLVYGHLPAARLTLRPWYTQRHLRRRARPGGP
ncbi:MAG: type IV secretory system conjugative DNA transfer family protein [Acidimicrobiales bacterium]